MKIFTIVGIRKSGKTTTVTKLTEEFKRRGLTVCTVKNVFCPTFSLDTPGSNTWRHRQAGADLVLVKGKQEMDVIWPYGHEDEIYPYLSCDILIMEGDYEACVPRIICAKADTEEIKERRNAHTIAVSGRISEKIEQYEDLPAIDAVSHTKELADFLLEHVPEAQFPLKKEEVPALTSGFCQCGCHKNERAQAKKREAVLPPANPVHNGMHIFLTGEKQIGKSTLLKKIRTFLSEEFKLSETGYETRPYYVEGIQKGFVLHGLAEPEGYENDCPITVRIGESKMTPVTETFEVPGVQLLEHSLKERKDSLMVLDEIGKAERKATGFQRKLWECLDQMEFVAGVLQKTDHTFVRAIAERPDVKVYTVTKENRDELFAVISKDIKRNRKGSTCA